MLRFFKPDWHTPTHLFGCFFLTKLIHCAFPSVMVLALAADHALVCGVIWEVLDEMFKGKWIFDPRGFDWGDIIADAVGCGLAVVVA